MKKLNIAFIKYGGMSSGGTEKFLQTIACNLNKEIFSVDYYYSDNTPYVGEPYRKFSPTNLQRLDDLEDKGVNIIKFNVEAKDITRPTHPWVGTNFFDVFDETKYDIIQTGRAGHKEFPFTKIRKTPIIDSIHLTAGADNQYNIARVMHICQWNADKWIASGGDASRVVLVSHPMEIDEGNSVSMRTELGIAEDVCIFGFHQRDSDDIFSPIPLEAYKQIENDKTHFILMGGSQKYRKQAEDLGLENVTFIDHSGDRNKIYSFLKILDVYAHGRKDGEVNSTAMAEAMYFKLPIISHTSNINNGHIEAIADAGVVVETIEQYAEILNKLLNNKEYLLKLSTNAHKRFLEHYELQSQIKNIENIYMDVVKNPYPNKWRRIWTSLHWTQNIRLWAKWLYLKYKYKIRAKI